MKKVYILLVILIFLILPVAILAQSQNGQTGTHPIPQQNSGSCNTSSSQNDDDEDDDDDDEEEGNGNGGSCGNNGGNGNNNDDDEDDDDEEEGNGNGGSCGNNGGNGNNDDDEDDDDEEEGNGNGGSCGNNGGNGNNDDDDDDDEDVISPLCPSDYSSECDYNVSPEFTGVPSGIDIQSSTYTDEIISTSCPLHIVRNWTIITSTGVVNCSQQIIINDTTAPVITLNTTQITSCAQLDELQYTVTDCDPNPVVEVNVLIDEAPSSAACDINGYRSQTQGGWGANPNGNNPATYLYANFNAAFPNGLTIGCNNTLTLTTAQAITAFLPSGSTPSPLPNGTMLNPGGTYNNVLAGQLVAATLSLTFDAYDADFGGSEEWVGNLVIGSGTFAGMTMQQLLEIANQVIGGCNTNYSFSQVNNALSSFNENFVDGTQNNGFLLCPESSASSSASNGADACIFIATYIITATDACGNTSEISGSFLYEDTTAPSFTNNATEVTLECGSPIPPIEITDECGDSNVTVTYIDTEYSGACAPSIERVYTAVDACGNVSTFTQFISFFDTTAPVITGIPNLLSYSCSEELVFDSPVISDNCGEVFVTYSEQQTGSEPCDYSIIRQWVAVDACGNTSSFTQVIEVRDNVAPVFTFVPESLVLNCNDPIPSNAPVATDNCSEVIITTSEVWTNAAGACASLTRTFQAADACGNISIASQVIAFIDNQAPILSAYPQDVAVTCGDIPSPVAITATDNCTSSLEVLFIEEEVFQTCGILIYRSWTATDNCGNSVTHTQIIDVVDDLAPVITGAANVTLECSALNNIPVVNATDNCSPNVVLTYTDEQQGSGCNYTIHRVWTAVDACGNQSIFVQNIQVQDTTAPVFSNVPASMTVSCGNIPAPVNPTAMDNCSGVASIDFTEQITGTGCSQLITRQWRAYDGCGNMRLATQTIQIADNIPPTIIGVPQNVSIQCTAGQIPPIPTNIQVQDNCDSNAQLQYNESTLAGTCEGSFTIVRTWTAFDACGNSSTAVQSVTISDTQAPVWSFIPSNISVACNVAIPDVVHPTALDNCSGQVEVSYFEFEENTTCGLIIYRNWFTSDDCGNMATLTQVVSQTDNISPVFSTAPVVQNLNCGDELPFIQAQATDNCTQEVDLFFTESTIWQGCVQRVRRTWTAIDACGNTATQEHDFYFFDTQSPVFTSVPADAVLSCEQLDTPVLPIVLDCNTVNITWTDNNDNQCASNGTITRVFVATDACGNSSTVSQLIIVEDTQAPVFLNPPADIVVSCNEIPAAPELAVSDNCDSNVEIIYEENFILDNSGSQTCSLSDAQVFFGDIALWLPGIAGATSNYRFDANGGSMQIDPIAGTAHVTGVVVNTINPEQKWLLDIYLNNARDWSAWSALGRGYKDDLNLTTGQHVDWTYYELVSTSSLIGQGAFSGAVLNLTHAPSNYFYGVQVGEGANNRNLEYGMSLWFNYSGSINGVSEIGHGDVFSENDCCNGGQVIREWTAIDCAGNSTVYTQTIIVNSAPVAQMAMSQIDQSLNTFSATTLNRGEVVLSFSSAQEGEITLVMLDMSGKEVRKENYQIEDANVTHSLRWNVSEADNGMYIIGFISPSYSDTEKIIISQ